jgi:hypothetical protein
MPPSHDSAGHGPSSRQRPRAPSFIQLTHKVSDWFRSIGILAAALVAVAGATLALAGLMIPRATGSADAGANPTAAVGEGTEIPVPTGAGGTLTVTGDLEGTFVLMRDAVEARYSLVGNDGRISFEGGESLTVAQISFQGWEFFPDPEQCTIDPGTFDPTTGVAPAELQCRDLEEVRDKGTVGLSGTVGIAGNVLGLRGDLPESGGSLSVGDETWEFDDAFIALLGGFGTPGVGRAEIVDEATGGTLRFEYDAQTHALALTEVGHGSETVDVPTDACQISTHDLGKAAPQTVVAELSMRCSAVEVPGLGTVPIEGTIIVDQVGA